MKKIFSIAIGFIAMIGISACADKDYTEKYANPAETSTVSCANVFTGVMYKGNTWMNPVYYRYYVQSTTSGIFSGYIGNTNSRGRFRGAGLGYFNVRWQNFYDMLTQYRLLEYTYNNLTESEQENNKIFLVLGKVVMQHQLHEMLSLFGDIPYSKAGTLWQTQNYSASKAPYDDDVNIYSEILSDLKEANTYLSGTIPTAAQSTLTRQDYVNGGSITKWRKFTNSLRLRIAIHLATNGDLTTEARAAIKEMLEDSSTYPMIDSNDENTTVGADASGSFNFGQDMRNAIENGAYGASSKEALTALGVASDGTHTSADARLYVLFDSNPDDLYIAYDNSLTNAEITDIGDSKHWYYADGSQSNASYYAMADSITFTRNSAFPGLWISAAEVSFCKAEAYLQGYGVTADATTAKEYFVLGMQQSTEWYYDVHENSNNYQSTNDSYMGFRSPAVRPSDSDVATYAATKWDETLNCIATQKWLNFGIYNELEAWNLIRRTGYPTITFATDTQVSDCQLPPNRLPYPSDEINYNSENYNAALSSSYGNGYYEKLFWAIENYYSTY